MPNSVVTAYSPIAAEGVRAQPSVWNSRYVSIYAILDSLASNLSAVGSFSTAGTVSAATFSGAFVGPWSGNTLRAESGNTITSLSTLSIAGGAVVSGKVHIGADSTQGGEASIYGLSVTKAVQNGAGAGGFAFAGELVATDSTDDLSGAQHLAGAQIAAIATSAGSYHELWGGHVYSTVSVGNTCDLAIGTYSQTLQSRGTLSCGVGAEVYVLRTGGKMDTAIGLAVGYHSTHADQGFDSVASSQYGIRVGPMFGAGSVNNYALSTSSGSVDLGDNLSVAGNIRYRAGASVTSAKVPGVLFSSAGPATTSTTTATLTGGSSGGTYVLKANTLATDGDTLRVVYGGSPGATTGTFALNVGGILIFSNVALSTNGTFAEQAWLTRSSSTRVYWTKVGAHFDAANVPDLSRSNGSVALDLTADQTILFQGSAAAGTLTGYTCQIFYEPTP